jgi:hypothetical protein
MKSLVGAAKVGMLLVSCCAYAQTRVTVRATTHSSWPQNGLLLSSATPAPSLPLNTPALPDSPGFANLQKDKASAAPQTAPQPAPQPNPRNPQASAPCPAAGSVAYTDPEATSAAVARTPCVAREDPYRRFLNSTVPAPLSPRQKGILALRNFSDPFNLLTVVGNAAVTIAADSHTAYGPGFEGFGRYTGYSVVQDATGEFLGTFLLCSVFSEDPHYHRMPDARPLRRVVHAISRTVIAQSDEGKTMPNFQNLIGYPASAEISNLYVPGVNGNGPSTVARIVTGLATDPISNLITEFLPDVARLVHVRVVFVQQIINEVATGQRTM